MNELEDVLPLAELPAGARVLDLGCGGGTVSYAGFPELSFVGLDQFAHPDTARWPLNAHLAVGRAERLPFRDGAFDAALCNFVFEHLGAPRSALREVARVLRPGALLYISIPRAGSLQDRLYRFTTRGGGHLQLYSFEWFVEMVYEETTFKLEGMAPAPGGFTWLREVPFGDSLRRLLYRAFGAWRCASGWDALAASDFLLLFRDVGRPGFKRIALVCGHCGVSRPALASPAAVWICPWCSFENLVVTG